MTLHGQNSKGFEKFLRFAALVAYVVLNPHFIFGSFLLLWQLFAGLRRLRSESGVRCSISFRGCWLTSETRRPMEPAWRIDAEKRASTRQNAKKRTNFFPDWHSSNNLSQIVQYWLVVANCMIVPSSNFCQKKSKNKDTTIVQISNDINIRAMCLGGYSGLPETN